MAGGPYWAHLTLTTYQMPSVQPSPRHPRCVARAVKGNKQQLRTSHPSPVTCYNGDPTKATDVSHYNAMTNGPITALHIAGTKVCVNCNLIKHFGCFNSIKLLIFCYRNQNANVSEIIRTLHPKLLYMHKYKHSTGPDTS